MQYMDIRVTNTGDNMKYLVGYKTDDGNWIFLKFRPSKAYPQGMYGCGWHIFDTASEAAETIAVVKVNCKNEEMGKNVEKWANSLRVIEIPEAATVKYDAKRALIAELDAQDREQGLVGNNSMLFKRGGEASVLEKEGWAILEAHLKTLK